MFGGGAQEPPGLVRHPLQVLLQQPGLARGSVPQPQSLECAPLGRAARRPGGAGERGLQDEHPAEREQPRPEPSPRQPAPGLAHGFALPLTALSARDLRPALAVVFPPVRGPVLLPRLLTLVRLLAADAARPFRAELRHRSGPRVRCHVRPS